MLHLSRYRVNQLWEHPGLLYEELDKLLNELEDDFFEDAARPRPVECPNGLMTLSNPSNFPQETHA